MATLKNALGYTCQQARGLVQRHYKQHHEKTSGLRFLYECQFGCV